MLYLLFLDKICWVTIKLKAYKKYLGDNHVWYLFIFSFLTKKYVCWLQIRQRLWFKIINNTKMQSILSQKYFPLDSKYFLMFQKSYLFHNQNQPTKKWFNIKWMIRIGKLRAQSEIPHHITIQVVLERAVWALKYTGLGLKKGNFVFLETRRSIRYSSCFAYVVWNISSRRKEAWKDTATEKNEATEYKKAENFRRV